MPAVTVSPLEVTIGIVLFWLAIGLLGILRPNPPDAITRFLYPLGAVAGVVLAVVGLVALGDCGCTGGIFGESYASRGRVSNVIPVDVAVPGCPPTPLAIMQGILTAISVKKS